MALLNVPPPPPPGLVDGSYDKRRCQWMNSEGMTYTEWRLAADAFRKKPLEPGIAWREWKNGVDPTEHADRR